MREPKEGKWTIKRGDISMIGIIKPLIPFNCIVDTDAGLIDLIRTDYRSPDMFNIGLLDSFKNGNELLKFLYERTVINPVIPFMNNPEDEDTANDIYRQFITQEYETIVKKSPFTGIFKMIQFSKFSEEITPTISYSNDIEKQFFENNSVLNSIKAVDIKDIPYQCSNLDVFFFKTIFDDFIRASLPVLQSKVVTILDYKYNFDENGDLYNTAETALIDANRCRFNIINAYNKKEIG